MSKRRHGARSQLEKRIDRTCYDRAAEGGGPQRGGFVSRGEGGEVQLSLCQSEDSGADNGRILGYDNTHNQHDRHYRGHTEPIQFSNYQALVSDLKRK